MINDLASELEENIIGYSLLSEQAASVALAELTPDDFYREENRVIWAAMLSIAQEGRTPTPINVADKMRKDGNLVAAGGASYLSGLMDTLVGTSDMEEQCEILKGETVLRKLKAMGKLTSTFDDHDKLLEFVQSSVEDVVSHTMARSAEDIGPAAARVVSNAISIHQGDSHAAGIKTGFVGIDRFFTRMSPGDLIILAARPGVGKSALATNIATNAAVGHDKTVLFISLEMTTEEIAARIIGSMENINTMSFKTGKFDTSGVPNDLERIDKARDILKDKKLVIDDRGSITVPQIKALARKIKAKDGLDLIVVDYLQLVDGPGENRTNIIGSVTRGLKQLAKDLGVPVLALSQLKRKGQYDSDTGHDLSELRESGNIEQDADKVFFVIRPGDGRDAQLQIAKHRGGPCGWSALRYVPEFTRFEDSSFAEQKS